MTYWRVYAGDAHFKALIPAVSAAEALQRARDIFGSVLGLRVQCDTAEPLYTCHTCKCVVTSEHEYDYPYCAACARRLK